MHLVSSSSGSRLQHAGVRHTNLQGGVEGCSVCHCYHTGVCATIGTESMAAL
jgi:hypothetical protein